MKRHRFDLPEFIRDPKYYDFLRNISQEQMDKLVSGVSTVTEDMLRRGYEARIKNIKDKYEQVSRSYTALDENYNNLLLASQHKFKANKIKPIASTKKHEATAKVIWSDWHVDEIVDPKKVNGLNRYNPEVARKRSQLCAVNTLKLVNKERRDIAIKNLVLHLGGDFIGGWIHEELKQTNSMSPIEAAIFAAELLIDAISHLVNNGKFDRIVIITSFGNHGRFTDKMQIGNQAETNFEKIIYYIVKRHFGDAIEFVEDDSTITYYKIYDLMGRFFHGHQIKYGGGIGGSALAPISCA